MSQQPKTETDRLANVIQVLQLGQKTGRLIVERNYGPRIEQGTITFVNGQVVQASINQQQGPEALNLLKSWGYCRFAFVTERNPGTTTGHMNAIQGQPPTLNKPDDRRGLTAPLRASTGSLSYPKQDIFNRMTGNLREQHVPTAWLASPYRARQMEDGMHLIEQMGLSRTHRRLFLLIDGRRTIRDLMRLMNHEPAEILKLLQDLERAGVIQI